MATIQALTKSFSILVTTNNGRWKSDKQRDFLLSMLDNLHYPSSFTGEGGSIYGNQYTPIYHCDETGVTRITMFYSTTSRYETEWERPADDVFAEARATKLVKREAFARLDELAKQASRLVARIQDKATKHDESLFADRIIDQGDDEIKAWADYRTKIANVSMTAELRAERRHRAYLNFDF